MPTVTMDQPSTGRNYDVTSLVPGVAASLRMWDRLGLSLGEAVVITDGHRWSRLTALVATWYGAVPVIIQSADSRPLPPAVTRLEVADPADRAKVLASLVNGLPAVVAAELSGRADAVDMLLEALPAMSRLMLAGNAAEALTIDYYVNVHRKGLHLMSCVLDDGASLDEYLERAERLLARPERAVACRAAIG